MSNGVGSAKQEISLPPVLNESGSSLVEALITLVILATIAVGVYPVFILSKKQSKYASVKQLCQKVVHTKLDEYRSGRTITSGEIAAAGDPLQNLSFPSFSATSQTMGLSGFFYAKWRYNQLFTGGVCNGPNSVSKAALLVTGNLPAFGPPAAPVDPVQAWEGTGPVWKLGVRECIGTNQWATDVAGVPDAAFTTPCSNHPTDRAVQGEAPGFKLYVKLQLESPWVSPPFNSAVPGAGNFFHRYCPNQTGWPTLNGQVATPPYDFTGVGEQIRITVTGVIDLPSVLTGVPGFKEIGNVADPLRLMCSATGTVTPENNFVRYYIDRSGVIFPISGGGRTAGGTRDPNTKPIFRNLYEQTAGVFRSSFRSISVSPKNNIVYALRSNSLTRYGWCGGTPLNCDITTTNANGLGDDGTPVAGLKTWTLPVPLSAISIDFRNFRIYGLGGDRATVYQLNCPFNHPGCEAIDVNSVGSEDVAYLNQIGSLTAVDTPGRMTSFFISPGGDGAYVSDMTLSDLFGAKSYQSTIYRAELIDPGSGLPTVSPLNFPLMSLPVDAIGFSM